MQLFVLSNHCTSKAHCATCRKLEEGRPWRKKLTKFFLLPDNNLDFDCPHGVPWEGKTPSQPMRAPRPALAEPPPPHLGNIVPPSGDENCPPCQRKRRQ